MSWNNVMPPDESGMLRRASAIRPASITRPWALRRIRLGRAALSYAGHGWDVTPGACFAGSRFSCGRLGCPTMNCHPALECWEAAASHDPGKIVGWWRGAPYTVLLATGHAFDVLEVPAYLGAAVAGPRWVGTREGRQTRGPVAVAPTGRWMLLVRPGEPLRPELDSRLDIVRHGPGSWIPAPPTRLLEGPVRWVISPEETDWRLPDPYPVQGLLVDALQVLCCQPGAVRATGPASARPPDQPAHQDAPRSRPAAARPAPAAAPGPRAATPRGGSNSGCRSTMEIGSAA
jgi:hypothetical protein